MFVIVAAQVGIHNADIFNDAAFAYYGYQSAQYLTVVINIKINTRNGVTVAVEYSHKAL